MPRHDVEISTPDGPARAVLHVPADPGPHPGVIMFPDALGIRPVFRGMGERLAGLGYVTLVPDIYHRDVPWAPFDVATVFGDEAERTRLMTMVHGLSAERIEADARAYVDYLTARPETTDGPVGTTGYCLGGRLSLIVAGVLGDRIAAAASFHGGSLAVDDDPDSPHHRAAGIQAEVYVAGATDDAAFPDEQRALLGNSLVAAGVTHTIETYPARHGFAVKDNLTHDAAAEDRHWDALTNLYGRTLGR